MINVKLNGSSLNLSEKTLSPIVVESQLDTSLDSGTVKYLATESDGSPLNDALASYSIGVGGKNFDFVGMDSRALVCRGGLTRQIVEQTVKATMTKLGPTTYRYSVSGRINTHQDIVEIISATSVRYAPHVQQVGRYIYWNASWIDSGLYDALYTIKVVFSYKTASRSVYLHEVSLTEPSKLLQGVMIDGFGVTQPNKVTAKTATKIAKQDSRISSEANALRYMHKAEGKIKSYRNFVTIKSVTGSVANSTPTAYYDDITHEIVWSVQWYDINASYAQPYTVTITYDYKRTNEKTLEDVVERLLSVSPFDSPKYSLTEQSDVRLTLSSVIAPEFKWNTQTTLWECLLQIGAVIDAVPRLVMDKDGKYTVVTFDFVNAFGNKADNISDQWTNADGQNINEGLYNTALSAVVENLRESD